jgi:protein-disulfide isomerase
MAILRVPINAGDHIRGPANAPVTLLEYGDYECLSCGRAHPLVNQLQAHFGIQLRFVFRHFPLTEIHENAEAAAESAEYAGAYGGFWEMHDLLYENQERLGPPLLFSIVQSLGRRRGFATRWQAASSRRRCRMISSAACAVV